LFSLTLTVAVAVFAGNEFHLLKECDWKAVEDNDRSSRQIDTKTTRTTNITDTFRLQKAVIINNYGENYQQ